MADNKDKPSFKYNVETLADDLGLQPASVRVALRKHAIDKTDGVYGWNTQADYKAVLAKLKGDAKKEPTEAKAKAKPKAKADADAE